VSDQFRAVDEMQLTTTPVYQQRVMELVFKQHEQEARETPEQDTTPRMHKPTTIQPAAA